MNNDIRLTKEALESEIKHLRSQIIRTEYDAEHLNQELQDMHLRLENLEVDWEALDMEEGC